ncbi:hypothetical protein PPYR_09554 [Photinus pyralis]|uniref:Mitochondrial import inner membrane translocase subunit Tim21 n=1 Tax=Photinus pyralis TaxID=7054 RepID=A0A1Y1KPY1_PHOPY|nr:mitochondrial import inner membrane translocase subunit Tim21 [Photinus pyralis]KAB0798561.1 hypothetical protein PPYR_09554 [Photinus pyralis]
MILRIIPPLTRCRRATLLQYSQIVTYQLCKRQKTDKSVTTTSRTELDTNVKPIGEKVKETTKTASYLGIILLGVGVTGALFYAVFSELFSSKSPNNIYTKAAKLCINDSRVQIALGEPITVYGEENRRRRRQHVSHVTYEKNGKKHLRMQFHLKGSVRKGKVQLEMQENDAGKYEYRYLFVEVEDLLHSTIVLEDNRSQDATLPSFV